MMYKKITLVLGAFCLSFFAQAQDENDALLLGRTYQYGTSRNLSLSGATGSLGADFGSISNNPAGLGLYRNSEFSFTPNILFTKSTGDYKGNSTQLSDGEFNFNQVGYVSARAKKGKQYKNSKWKASNISIGISRLANIHSDFTYQGADNTSSFVENFAEEINDAGGISHYTDNTYGVGTVSEAAIGAFETYVVDRDLNDTTQASSFVPFGGGLNRSKTIQRKGGINELSFSYGANYNEKLLFGFSIGIPFVNYNQTEILTEDDASGDLNNDFEYVDLVQKINVEGNGLNLKLGTIFKPNKALRFGVSLHTPTWYSITDVSSIEFESNTENLLSPDPAKSTYVPESGNLFEYRFHTPMKAIGSGTAFFGKKGFVSADVEWVNYEGMKYRYGDGFEAAEQLVNTAIQNTYQNAVNVRIGGEFRIDQMAVRGGYAYYGSPYQDFKEGATQSASVGLGYRAKKFYLDLAGRYLFTQFTDITHTLARTVNIPTANISTGSTLVSMTLGFRF